MRRKKYLDVLVKTGLIMLFCVLNVNAKSHKSAEEIYEEAIQKPAKDMKRYLKYKHHFSWRRGPFTMKVKVDGKVQISTSKTALTAKGVYKEELPLEQVSGSGKIPITGQIKIITKDMKCDCRMNSSLLVKVTGVSRYVINELNSPVQKLNLKPDETWYSGTKWHCKCNKPIYARMMASNLNKMPMQHIDSFKEHTLEFYDVDLCRNQYYETHLTDPTKLGKGTYRWTLFTDNQFSDDNFTFGSPPDAFETPPVSPCVKLKHAKLGPPLETIHTKVQEWYPQ